MPITRDHLNALDRCVQLCEKCATRITSVTMDRLAATYCRDVEQHCTDLREAILTDDANIRELAVQCLHSVERCVARCETWTYDFCKECAEACREVAEIARELAA